MSRSLCIRFWYDKFPLMRLYVLLILCMLFCSNSAAAVFGTTEDLEVSLVYYVGDEITLGGRTNLSPGTTLHVTVEEAAFSPGRKDERGVFSGTSGTVVVQDGLPFFWFFSFSTAGWTPGTYLAIVESPKTGAAVSVTFSLLPRDEATGVPAPSASQPPVQDTPTSTPAPPAPSPTSVPLSPAFVVAGCAMVYLFRAHRF